MWLTVASVCRLVVPSTWSEIQTTSFHSTTLVEPIPWLVTDQVTRIC